MKKLLSAVFLGFWFSTAQAAVVVPVPVTISDDSRINAFLTNNSLRTLNHYDPKLLDSGGLVEQVLFRRAVLLGGLDAKFSAFIVPNSARARESIRDGSAVGGGFAAWNSFYQENTTDFYESDAVIPVGRFEKGLYTTAQKLGQLKIKTSHDLQHLSVVSTKTWVIDWATLEQLKFAKIMDVPTMEQQFRMVQAGWADITLHDFANTPDMSVVVDGIRLYPIPGVKVALIGSRHFIVSRKHPAGAQVFEALQNGLKIMQKTGEIDRAFFESGFYNMTARNWLLLTPE
ncbi:MAG: hypothetical protein P4L87_16755 [Formivibrio sp.]|nr:hypothetical protein [Formivibrio sp.]